MKPYWLEINSYQDELVDTDTLFGTLDIALIRKHANNTFSLYIRELNPKNPYGCYHKHMGVFDTLESAKTKAEEILNEYILSRGN